MGGGRLPGKIPICNWRLEEADFNTAIMRRGTNYYFSAETFTHGEPEIRREREKNNQSNMFATEKRANALFIAKYILQQKITARN